MIAHHPDVFETSEGTPYLREPGVVLLGSPKIDMSGLGGFLENFHPDLEFEEYLQDPTPLNDAAQLAKVAGQLCYLSFGPKCSTNADAGRYFENILESGHGSVLEHANISFLFYGISRSVTHELVRHRAGAAYSQVSQRYVDGTKLRFVCRPEWLAEDEDDPNMLASFEQWIDLARSEYDDRAKRLMKRQEKRLRLLEGAGVSLRDAGFSRTDLRKEVNQAARSVLPNETEAPILTTANVRAWRHMLNMRGALAADAEIRQLYVMLAPMLVQIAPEMFQDVRIEQHPYRGPYVKLDYPKV